MVLPAGCVASSVMRSAFRAGLPAVLAAGLSAAIFPALAMEFATVPLGADCHIGHCPRAMIAEGEITGDAPQRFQRFLQGEMRIPGLHALLFINSPGGNVESALKLGSMLHQAGASAVVGRPAVENGRIANTAAKRQRPMMNVAPGQCASACVYTLMGAKRRVVPQGARLGVHRMSARLVALDPAGGKPENNRIFAGEEEIRALRSYAASVGGSQDLITLAESVPHDRIRVLTETEIRRFRLGQPKL